MAYRTLVHIRQHGVSPTKGQQSRLGEKPAHLREGVLPTQACSQQTHGHQPQQCTGYKHFGQMNFAETGMLGCRGVVVN